MSARDPNKRVELQKNLSTWHVWALALGCIIGWGCFVLPGTEFLPNAGPMGAILGFFIGAGFQCFVAVTYAKMLENYPVAGGAFVYSYAGFGPTAAFICGWALVLGYMSIIALNLTALSLLSRFLLPGVFEFGFLYSVVGWDIYFGELAFLMAILLLFAFVNYRGGEISGSVQLWMAVLLIIGIFVLFGSVFATEGGSSQNLTPLFAEGQSPLASVIRIVAIAPWLYVGFDTIPQTAEEFDFAPSKAKGLMLMAILFGALCYALVTFSVAYVFPYKEFLASNPIWAAGSVAVESMGRIGSIVLAMAVTCAICTGMNGFFMATTRLMFSVGRAGFLPAWFTRIHPKYGTPHNTVIFTAAFCLIAPWFGRQALDWIVSMSAIGTVVAYGFTSMATLRMCSASPTMEKRRTTQFFAVMSALTSLLCLGLLTIPGSPAAIGKEAWVALIGWVVLGIIFFGVRAKDIHSVSTAELSYRILGDKDKPVFFRPRVVPQLEQ